MDMDTYRQLSLRMRAILSTAHLFQATPWRGAFAWVLLATISAALLIGSNFLLPRNQAMSIPFSSQELKELEAYATIQGARSASDLASMEERSRRRGLPNAWIDRDYLETMTGPAFASPSISPDQLEALAKMSPNIAASLAEREALRLKIRGSLAASATCRNYADKIFGLDSPVLSPMFDEGCIAADKTQSFLMAALASLLVLVFFSCVIGLYALPFQSGKAFLSLLTNLGLSPSKEEWLSTRGAATLSRIESVIFALASLRLGHSSNDKAKARRL